MFARLENLLARYLDVALVCGALYQGGRAKGKKSKASLLSCTSVFPFALDRRFNFSKPFGGCLVSEL